MIFEKWRFGRPIYELSIDLKWGSQKFEAFKFLTTGEQYEGLDPMSEEGLACSFTHACFSGFQYVTEKGYFLAGETLKEPIPTRRAVLDISENVESLILLRKDLFKGKTIKELNIGLNYEDGEWQFIKSKRSHLYLPLVRAEFRW